VGTEIFLPDDMMREMQKKADETDNSENKVVLYGGQALVQQWKYIREKYAKSYGSDTLHKQQQRRLFHATKVEKKIIIFLIPDLHHPRPERNIIAPK